MEAHPCGLKENSADMPLSKALGQVNLPLDEMEPSKEVWIVMAPWPSMPNGTTLEKESHMSSVKGGGSPSYRRPFVHEDTSPGNNEEERKNVD